jgi:hypothetical protein
MMEFMDKVIDKLPNTINNTNAHRKGNKMVTSNSDDFEIINADDISFVKRGRKASVNPALVEALKTLANGKAMALKSLKVDPKANNFANEKARIASQIRTACREANLTNFRILWSPQGIPQVVR